MAFLIELPEPCHENWDKMTPTERGRFCFLCQKEVTDCTSMTTKQIRQYFDKNPSSCVRITQQQLQQTYQQTNQFYQQLTKLVLTFGFAATFTNYATAQEPTIRTEQTEIKHKKKKRHKKKKPHIELPTGNGFGTITFLKTNGKRILKGAFYNYDKTPVEPGVIKVPEINDSTKFDGSISNLDGTFELEIQEDYFTNPLLVHLRFLYYEPLIVELTLGKTEEVELINEHLTPSHIVITGGAFKRRLRLHQRILNIFRQQENRRY